MKSLLVIINSELDEQLKTVDKKIKEIEEFWDEYQSIKREKKTANGEKIFIKRFLKNHYYDRGIDKYDEYDDMYYEYIDRAKEVYELINRMK